MNEITRIHIAKTPYDIEVAAKKQLEKYIKSLEAYTQGSDVLADIEIRITEILAERGVKAGGVISSDDVAAMRAQLGEPYEFSNEEGDIAVGPSSSASTSGRRLFRSPDDAVLGGVLSGFAAYFNINPLWTRLAFIFLLFISFGLAFFVYIIFWIITPPARTATEKLQLAGKPVTVESIKQLNIEEELQPNATPPVLQRILGITLGVGSLIGSVLVGAGTIWLIVAALARDAAFVDATNGFMGLGDGNSWIVWLIFWIVVFGSLLLAGLLGLIAYAFLARKLNKKMVVSGILIIALGITSVAAAVGISATQSMRAANESRNMVRDIKANLPKEFAQVKTVTFVTTNKDEEGDDDSYFSSYATIRYVVEDGPARYELTALPSTKPSVSFDGNAAIVSLNVPHSFRNSFVQPILTIYGPALDTVNAEAMNLEYNGLIQDALTVTSTKQATTNVSGTYTKVTVKGFGSVDLGSSAVQNLTVESENGLHVTAGTVRILTVTQPDVCSNDSVNRDTQVSVADITSGDLKYNGKDLPATTHKTSCALVKVESDTTNLYE